MPDAPALDDLSPPALDLDAIRERYPLLRNALYKGAAPYRRTALVPITTWA